MRLSIKSIPRGLLLGLVLVGCVDTRGGGDDSEHPGTGAPDGSTGGVVPDTTDTSAATDGACTAPHEPSTGTTGEPSTTGADEPEPDPGTSSSDDEPDGPVDTGAPGDDTGEAGETGEEGDTGEDGETGATGETGETGGAGETGETTGGTTGGDAGGPSFAGDVWPVFDDRCGCHTDKDGAGKLKLKQDVAFANLVGQQSDQLPSMLLVEPGSSATSYLWHKLDGTHKSVGGEGKIMPPGGKLDMAELELVKLWIDQGAAP